MKQQLLDLAYRLDPALWARKVLGFEPDPWQEEVLRSNDPNLCLVCSRQSGKTTTVSVLTAHTAVFNPNNTSLIVSPGQRQSSEMFRKAAAFVKTAIGGRHLLDEDNKLSLALANGSRIISVPANEAGIRSYSVDLLVCDEAARIADAVLAAVRPMVAATRGRTALLSTPFGREGFFADVALTEELKWRRWVVPVSECPRIPQSFLDDERKLLGEQVYRQEYECDFLSQENAAFQWQDVEDAYAQVNTENYGDEDPDREAYRETAFAV